MRIDVVTMFPKLFPGPLEAGIIGRALDDQLLCLHVHDLRGFAPGPHHQVDDETFGGGAGMVLKPEPLFAAVEHVERQLRPPQPQKGPVILLSPQGKRLIQEDVVRLSDASQLTLICGRYEGVDERVRESLIDAEISIGDFVLTGGELASMVLIEAIGRLQPGALGDPESARHDSFSDGLLDHPHYTRPAEFRALQVPPVLRSGDHGKIRRWRRQQALLNTARKRPDLLAARNLSEEEQRLLAETTD